MTRDDLIDAGEALYGPRWQSEVARLLSIDDRRVRAWLSGERPIPAGIAMDLAAALRKSARRAAAVANRISN